MKRILTVGLSPTIQKTILFRELALDAVNRSTGYRLDASGKAVNAARVLHQTEPGSVVALCPLGIENSSLFLALASRDGLAIESVEIPGRVRYCYTLVEPGIARATELVVGEENEAADWEGIADGLVARIAGMVKSFDALLFAGSRPASWPEGLPARILSLARDAGCQTMADFHGPDLLLALDRRSCDVVKINEEEFCGTFGYAFPLGEAELASRIEEKSAECGCAIVVTRGAKDTLASSRSTGYRGSVQPVRAVNPIGCGDAFSAGFFQVWIQGAGMDEAISRGAWCATRNALSFRPGSVLDPAEAGEGITGA